MPAERIDGSINVKINKPRKKTVGKKRSPKTPFAIGGDLAAAPVMPATSLKAKAQAVAPKTSQAGSVYRKLAVSFAVLTLILVAAVLYFNFSSLTIVIIPAQEKVSDSSAVEIINQAVAVAPPAGQIYGAVKQVPVELTREFSASGQDVLGEEVTGKVTIINNYIKNQPLVATTRLLSGGNKLFRLKDTVNVPAGSRLEAEIYADEAKPELAIGPSKFTIPGLWAGLQDKIYAESKAPLKFNQKIKYSIKQSDIDNAVKALKNDLLANAKNQVKEAYQDYAQALFAVDNNSVTQEVSGKVGEEKETFSLKMKIMVTVVAFNDEEIFGQARAKLAAILADDKEIVEFSKSDISYALENFNLSQGAATVNVSATAKTTLKDGAKIIKKSNLAGLEVEQLKTYLNSLPEVAGYEIKFFPSFIKKAPSLADRIKIEIKK